MKIHFLTISGHKIDYHTPSQDGIRVPISVPIASLRLLSSSPPEPLVRMPVLDSIPVKRPLPNGPALLHQNLRLSVKAIM